MLNYIQRGRFIGVSRPPISGGPKRGQLIATIESRNFSVRFIEDAKATKDEVDEIEGAAQELKAAPSERQAAIFEYPTATRSVMTYYAEKANDLDKQLIGGALRGAFRTLRKLTPREPNEATDRPKAAAEQKPSASISPEQLAAELHKVLESCASKTSKIKGIPGNAKKTEIRGFWDLNEVARRLLSQA